MIERILKRSGYCKKNIESANLLAIGYEIPLVEAMKKEFSVRIFHNIPENESEVWQQILNENGLKKFLMQKHINVFILNKIIIGLKRRDILFKVKNNQKSKKYLAKKILNPYISKQERDRNVFKYVQKHGLKNNLSKGASLVKLSKIQDEKRQIPIEVKLLLSDFSTQKILTGGSWINVMFSMIEYGFGDFVKHIDETPSMIESRLKYFKLQRFLTRHPGKLKNPIRVASAPEYYMEADISYKQALKVSKRIEELIRRRAWILCE